MYDKTVQLTGLMTSQHSQLISQCTKGVLWYLLRPILQTLLAMVFELLVLVHLGRDAVGKHPESCLASRIVGDQQVLCLHGCPRTHTCTNKPTLWAKPATVGAYKTICLH